MPWTFLKEPMPADAAPEGLACGFLQLSPVYEAEAALAAAQGWPVKRLDLHHLAMLTHPQLVAEALAGLAERLPGAT